ncbi:hypothetical protein DPMN_030298 [Dreissena polymorpha]|uniref:Tetratricopeptide repeat protein 30 n=1 Tax=Dreissena polymorpha TaxID=45954 RepID=A0A9D4LYS4_DREPO|nr:hypothetical protein DPMN_030298 [Dreissena polymorpha]
MHHDSNMSSAHNDSNMSSAHHDSNMSSAHHDSNMSSAHNDSNMSSAHNDSNMSSAYLYDFLEAVITRQTSPEEAYRKLDEMATKQTETLRKLTKQVQEARTNHDDEAVKKAVNEYDEALER